MRPDRTARTPLLVFGIVAACVGMSLLHALAGAGMPIWSICCRLTPLASGLAQVALWTTLVLMILHGGLRSAVGLSKTRCFMSLVGLAAAKAESTRLAGLARNLSLSPFTVILATDVPLAFCYGLLRPRICVSTGLIRLLTDRELEAVLRHEDYHRRQRDPLRKLLLEALAGFFALLPVTGELCDLWIIHSELEADRNAVQAVGRAPVAGALHKMLMDPLAARLTLPGVAAFDATQARIAALLNDQHAPFYPSPASLVRSSAVLMALCILAL